MSINMNVSICACVYQAGGQLAKAARHSRDQQLCKSQVHQQFFPPETVLVILCLATIICVMLGCVTACCINHCVPNVKPLVIHPRTICYENIASNNLEFQPGASYETTQFHGNEQVYSCLFIYIIM